MKEKDLISIIIPVYNVESFLPKCLDSVINQTYEKIEIILVNDGSKDDSGLICDEYAKKDARIRVVHKANGGLSDARNVGIENAKGEFICFVDSDDAIDRQYVEVLYDNILNTNSDIAICSFKKFIEDEQIENFKQEATQFEELGRHELILKLFEKNNIHFICACTKLYRKQLFETLRFDVGKLHEDEFIVYKIFNQANKAVVVDNGLYFYRERQGSITKAKKFAERNLDSFYSIESCYNFFVGTDYEHKALNRLINSTAYIYCIAKKRKANKEILKFLLQNYKKYYKLNSTKTLKQKLFKYFPNFVSLIKKV